MVSRALQIGVTDVSYLFTLCLCRTPEVTKRYSTLHTNLGCKWGSVVIVQIRTYTIRCSQTYISVFRTFVWHITSKSICKWYQPCIKTINLMYLNNLWVIKLVYIIGVIRAFNFVVLSRLVFGIIYYFCGYISVYITFAVLLDINPIFLLLTGTCVIVRTHRQ